MALERHVVTRAQLLAQGLSAGAISRRTGDGRLVPLHRGVYAIGGTPPSRRQRWAAAVAACGTACLSHLSAAALWRLLRIDPTVIDVTLVNRSTRARRGVRVHRPIGLSSGHVTSHLGIPVTSPARTILDCAAVLPTRSLERVLDEAEYLRLLHLPSMQVVLEGSSRVPGVAHLRAVLYRHTPGTTRTRNPLEEAFLLLVRHAGLPQPEVNARLGPYEIDFLWREQRVAVETDGRQSHERTAQRERDYRRDAWLTAEGFRPLRFTWTQVRHRPEEVRQALVAALGEAEAGAA